jgi:hypothetical protein
MIIQIFAKIKCVTEIMILANSIVNEKLRKQIAITCSSIHADPAIPNGIYNQIYALGIFYPIEQQIDPEIKDLEIAKQEKENDEKILKNFHLKLSELLLKFPEPQPPKMSKENIRRPGGYINNIENQNLKE